MNTTNYLVKESITAYIKQVYKAQPLSDQFITISSHILLIPESGTLIVPKSPQSESTSKTRYFIRGISIHMSDDNLEQQQLDTATLKIICGGQTWISGQLGLLDLITLKNLIIPIPDTDADQEIIIQITDLPGEKLQKSGSLTYDVVAAPNFTGENMPCYRQIIYPIPETGIIYDDRNKIVAYKNHIARIEVYVPDDIEYKPQIYCNDIPIELMPEIANPSTEISSHNKSCDTKSTATTSYVSEPSQLPFLCGYKTYKFDTSNINTDSLLILSDPLFSTKTTDITTDITTNTNTTTTSKIKYSLIENQVVRFKNGYIGLAF
jgi:hypothetical protein